MNVLLTGAFGNLGSLVLENLLKQGHKVTCFDIKNKTNEKIASQFVENLDIFWGDIRDKKTLRGLVGNQDAIIHLAAIIHPFSDLNPELAREVNVTGTETLLHAAEKSHKNPVFVFASSIAVFGHTQKLAPPRTIADPVEAKDCYSEHKIECEKLIKESTANWVILRIGGMVDSRMRHSDKEQMKLAFSVAADNRIEFIHPKDAATAFVNAICTPEAEKKILLLGGGENCQITQFDLVTVMSRAMGVNFPKSAFGSQQLYTDWLDTTEANQLLDFQQHSFEDLRQECFKKFRFLRWLIRPLSPLIAPLMLRLLGV